MHLALDSPKKIVLSRVAAAQHGHVAGWQLRQLGISKTWVAIQLDFGGWTRAHIGVYRLPGVPITHEGTMWAALLAVAGEGGPRRSEHFLNGGMAVERALVCAVSAVAAVTGMSAAWLREARQLPPDEPEILVPSHVQVRRSGMRVVRSTFDATTVTTVRGVPCVPPERVLWDVAWLYRSLHFAANMVGDVAVAMDRLRRFSVDELLATVEESVSFGLPRRVPRALREAAEILRPGFSHSRTEAIGREIALEVGDQMGIELTPRPHPILHGGRIIAEADIAAPDLRWDAEIDGPHHMAPSVRARDRLRDGGVWRIDWAVNRYPHTLIDHHVSEYRRRFTTDLQGIHDRRS